MIIQAEFLAGTDIKDAFWKAEIFAQRNNVSVKFNFNGIICYAHSNGNSLKGEENYHEAIDKHLICASDL